MVAIYLTGFLHCPRITPKESTTRGPGYYASRGASITILSGLAIQKPHLTLLSLRFVTSLLCNLPKSANKKLESRIYRSDSCVRYPGWWRRALGLPVLALRSSVRSRNYGRKPYHNHVLIRPETDQRPPIIISSPSTLLSCLPVCLSNDRQGGKYTKSEVSCRAHPD